MLRNVVGLFEDNILQIPSFITGFFIVTLHALQIFFIRNKFPKALRSQANPLSVLLLNFSISDLVLGVTLLLIYMLGTCPSLQL